MQTKKVKILTLIENNVHLINNDSHTKELNQKQLIESLMETL